VHASGNVTQAAEALYTISGAATSPEICTEGSKFMPPGSA
jgi:hypothetical protein